MGRPTPVQVSTSCGFCMVTEHERTALAEDKGEEMKLEAQDEAKTQAEAKTVCGWVIRTQRDPLT